MTTLAVNAPRDYELGDINEFPVVAADIIYEGAAVGIVKASGHARPLTSADKFVGFCEKKVDNSSGAAAALTVRVAGSGKIPLSISGAVETDLDIPVYAQDDNSFSFIKTSGVFVGKTCRYISSGKMVVSFDVGAFVDPHEGFLAETISDNKTLDAEDSGKVFFVDTDAKAITLPAVGGISGIRIVNAGAYGTVAVTVSPNSADMIEGPDITAADDKDIINTKATAQRGDFIQLNDGDANGWVIVNKIGTWARQA